ncbi:hypothetical protein [Niveibacterium terrae]|uniref:hypothetical protein n=1 Tax=Niveibacterium terrae TaxID=3373598 RepID=UPI003A8E11E4
MNIDSATPAGRPAAQELKVAQPTAGEVADTAPLSDKNVAANTAPQVELSRTAKLMAKNDAAATGTVQAPGTTEAAGSASSVAEKIPVKEAQSFVYGALGLERPDEAPKKEDAFYTAGKWLSAAGTAGMVISLLV